MKECPNCGSDLLSYRVEDDSKLLIACAECKHVEIMNTKPGSMLHSKEIIDIFGSWVIKDSDICHSLANQCRYNGHTNGFYSVAEHCCLLYDLCGEPWALLHDAAEAYIGDMVPQIRMVVPLLDSLESWILRCIADHYGLPHAIPDIVLSLDYRIRVNEMADAGVNVSGESIPNLKIQHWMPAQAEFEFSTRLKKVKNDLSRMQEENKRFQVTPI
jgi:hypothetical protein